MYQAGLVLEGGGMKGVYTAGVLDFFTEKGIDFSHIYGVSAGACHMCSYLSRQKGRALSVSVDYLDTRRYCSLESLLTSGDLFNVDFCYHLIPDYLYPYDYDTFEKYPGKAYSVVTNIETGQPEYLRVRDIRKDIDKIRASASLPLVTRNVKIDGKLYLDGGMEVAKSFILPFITEGKHAEADYKTRLQEIVQQNPEERLSYVVEQESGPDHDKHFVVAVRFNSDKVARGEGRSKKMAEQHAAREALKLLGVIKEK